MSKLNRLFSLVAFLAAVALLLALPLFFFAVQDSALFSGTQLRPVVAEQLSAQGAANDVVRELFVRKHIWGEEQLQWSAAPAPAEAAPATEERIAAAVQALCTAEVLTPAQTAALLSSLQDQPADGCTEGADGMGFCRYSWGDFLTVPSELVTEPLAGRITSLYFRGKAPSVSASARDKALRAYLAYLEVAELDDWVAAGGLQADTTAYYSEKAQLYAYLRQSGHGVLLGVFSMTKSEFEAIPN